MTTMTTQRESASVIARFKPLGNGEEDQFFRACKVRKLPQGKTLLWTPGSKNTVDSLVRGLSQEDFYVTHVRPAALRVLEGYNASVLCYGYSGSGKTFTVFGKPGNEGVAFRGIRDFLEDPRTSTVRVKVVEVYLDQVYDLLLPPGSKNTIQSIAGATSLPVEELEEARRIFSSINRKTSRNNVHDKSSRSHCVIVVEVQTDRVHAELYVADLAGCERYYSEPGSQPASGTAVLERETKTINRSVFALNKVVKACADGKTHIPYRDSRITMILNRAIGGNSSTLVVLCCNATSQSETVFSLRFGQRCQKVSNIVTRGSIELPGSYAGPMDVDEKSLECARLEALVAELKTTIGDLTLRLEGIGQRTTTLACVALEETPRAHDIAAEDPGYDDSDSESSCNWQGCFTEDGDSARFPLQISDFMTLPTAELVYFSPKESFAMNPELAKVAADVGGLEPLAMVDGLDVKTPAVDVAVDVAADAAAEVDGLGVKTPAVDVAAEVDGLDVKTPAVDVAAEVDGLDVKTPAADAAVDVAAEVAKKPVAPKIRVKICC